MLTSFCPSSFCLSSFCLSSLMMRMLYRLIKMRINQVLLYQERPLNQLITSFPFFLLFLTLPKGYDGSWIDGVWRKFLMEFNKEQKQQLVTYVTVVDGVGIREERSDETLMEVVFVPKLLILKKQLHWRRYRCVYLCVCCQRSS